MFAENSFNKTQKVSCIFEKGWLKSILENYKHKSAYNSLKLVYFTQFQRIIEGFMVGRINEQKILKNCLESPRAEFVVVYGRRRVGKTYLIKEYFNQRFSFYATGLSNTKTSGQLRAFSDSLKECGYTFESPVKDWYEAFSCLKALLSKSDIYRDPVCGKRVVFLDELPWMDTARSDFRSALDYFWNSWGSSQRDLCFIVCGSATSWIIDHLVSDKGGFYNRITRQIHLQPFTLKECEDLFVLNGVSLTRQQIIESYMVFGGIPYYLNCFDKRLSLAQNIEELCFKESGQLYYEYDRLFQSLFKKPDKHLAIIRAVSNTRGGISRVELAKVSDIGDGEPLTKALKELEQCGFVRKYKNYAKKEQGAFFQLIDPFTRFCLEIKQTARVSSWLLFQNTPAYFTWCGNAFELVCLLHVRQIKSALGIAAVETFESAWRSKTSTPGAQIDLLIDRRDGVINVCEIKHTIREFAIDSAYSQQLLNKLEAFRKEMDPHKALHLTLISASGLVHNEYAGIVQSELTAEDLFRND